MLVEVKEEINKSRKNCTSSERHKKTSTDTNTSKRGPCSTVDDIQGYH